MASVKTRRGSFCWSLGHVVKWSRSDGTIEIKEVKEKLNISGAMVLNYVKQGKIKHVVPPGRKHGYYLEKDVEKLASELQAFFDLEEETENTEFTVATAADIPACIALNRELFDIKNTEAVKDNQR